MLLQQLAEFIVELRRLNDNLEAHPDGKERLVRYDALCADCVKVLTRAAR